VLLLIYRASRPNVAVLGASRSDGTWVDVSRHPDAETREGIVVVRPEGGLWYANSDNVRAAVLHLIDDHVDAVVFDAQTVPSIDTTAAESLTRLNEELTARHITFVIARDVGQVRDVLEHAGLGIVANGGMYRTVREGIIAIDAPHNSKTDGQPPEAG
jgi:sulfate permease, SulP family